MTEAVIAPPGRAAQVRAYVGLGANLGDARQSVLRAVEALTALPGVQVLRVSSLYGSAPQDATGPDYVNAVLSMDTALAPLALLQALQAVENAAGRVRPYPNAPRTLDLDLLLYGTLVLHSAVLTLPHPRMHQRAFVLVPLAEVAPELVDAAALRAVQDQPVWRL